MSEREEMVPDAVIDEILRQINGEMSDENLAVVREKLLAKDQYRRFQQSIAVTAQLLQEGPALVQGTPAERQNDWRRCTQWVEELWVSAADLWRGRHYAVAVAIAISTIEEAGKLVAERFRLLGADSMDMSNAAGAGALAQWKPRKQPFRDHFTKHVLATTAAASVNARLDRVLGIDFVIEFLDQAEDQQLERLRQACLYLDRPSDLHVPDEQMTPASAARYVALAGEIVAELMVEPEDWTRLLDRVRQFERAAGLPDE